MWKTNYKLLNLSCQWQNNWEVSFFSSVNSIHLWFMFRFVVARVSTVCTFAKHVKSLFQNDFHPNLFLVSVWCSIRNYTDDVVDSRNHQHKTIQKKFGQTMTSIKAPKIWNFMPKWTKTETFVFDYWTIDFSGEFTQSLSLKTRVSILIAWVKFLMYCGAFKCCLLKYHLSTLYKAPKYVQFSQIIYRSVH